MKDRSLRSLSMMIIARCNDDIYAVKNYHYLYGYIYLLTNTLTTMDKCQQLCNACPLKSECEEPCQDYFELIEPLSNAQIEANNAAYNHVDNEHPF